MIRWAVTVVFAALLALAPMAGAQDLSDEDRDRVPDEADLCLDTPRGDFVDEYGCSVCDCEGTPDGDGWPSRHAYVRCVLGEAKARRAAGRITGGDLRAAVRRARASSCGNEDLTRCCVFPAAGGPGRCRVLDWERCDAATLHVHDAVDWDVGSCLPNPCNDEE